MLLQLNITVLVEGADTRLSDGTDLGAVASGVNVGGTHFESRPTH